MKKITFIYENLPRFTFEMEVNDDVDIEELARVNQLKIVKVEDCEE